MTSVLCAAPSTAFVDDSPTTAFNNNSSRNTDLRPALSLPYADSAFQAGSASYAYLMDWLSTLVPWSSTEAAVAAASADAAADSAEVAGEAADISDE